MQKMPIDWEKMKGLVPVVVQHSATLEVLMLGYMNEESLDKTVSTGLVTFYSRSKKRLWMKGETSGHTLEVVDIHGDCDQDAILIKAKPNGPTCHKGTTSCFDGNNPSPSSIAFLAELSQLIKTRYQEMPEGSYTTQLFQKGMHKMAQKVGEEGVEVALAAKDEDQDAFLGECADLIYHLIVLARAKGFDLSDISETLRQRHS